MSSEATPQSRPWYYRIGPGLITACVVIGPGSIVSSSKVGANQEYSMLWVVAISVIFMMLYMTIGARLGVMASKAPGDLIRERAGSGLAILVGCCAFFISAAFQSGNNIGVGAAFKVFVDSEVLVGILIVLFNAVAVSFLYVFKDLYKMLERVMMGFVALMLICFAVNLVLLGPDFGALLKGLIPSTGKGDARPAGKLIIELLALVGTTFVITAAYYQAYLVRQKGWKEAELKSGLLDARIGSIIMFLITVMLMSTAAAGLYTGPGSDSEEPRRSRDSTGDNVRAQCQDYLLFRSVFCCVLILPCELDDWGIHSVGQLEPGKRPCGQVAQAHDNGRPSDRNGDCSGLNVIGF